MVIKQFQNFAANKVLTNTRLLFVTALESRLKDTGNIRIPVSDVITVTSQVSFKIKFYDYTFWVMFNERVRKSK